LRASVLGERKAVALCHRREAMHVLRRQHPGERRVANAFEPEQQRFRHAAVHLARRERKSRNPVVLAKRQARNAALDYPVSTSVAGAWFVGRKRARWREGV
jgi:hypothetical protein